MKTFLEILSEGCEGNSFRNIIDNLTDEQIFEAVEQYGNERVKEALKLASEKAVIEHTWCIDLHEVDKESILNLDKELMK